MEVASYTGTVKYIRNGKNGEDAVSYEIVPSTSALSVDANGNWASGTALWDQDKSYAVVKCYVYKVVGSKRELCKGTVLYYTSEGSKVAKSIFNNGFFYVYVGKSASVIDACVYAFNMAIGKPVGDPLAMTSITINHDGTDGERGSAGAIWRHHKGFVDSSETEPYEYMAGGNDEKFIDVVLIGKIWYQCISKYESTGTTDTRNTPGSSEFGKYWSAADMNMTFIATDFLLAENAKINLFGSNEINLYGSNENGKIFGSFRVPNGNGDDSAYALWLGAETGKEAPFSVTNKGYLKAIDAEISGTIMAKYGSIGGFKINEDALGSKDGRNMYLTNNFIHFGNWGAFFHNAGYKINLGYQNRCGVEVSSFSSDTNNINVGGYFHVTANSEKDKGSYCAALELASLWATGAGDIDMTDAEKGNHAILIHDGDVAGLRPSFVRIDKSKTLSCYNYNIECYNAKDITLTLPDTEGIWGQHLVVIQRGDGKVIFTSTCNIHDLNANKDSKTWFSGTRGQVSYFWFNGTEWLVRYINR